MDDRLARLAAHRERVHADPEYKAELKQLRSRVISPATVEALKVWRAARLIRRIDLLNILARNPGWSE
jgi:hypothetical protein